MQTKPLLYGLIGFFIGGLLVSVAATTFDKPQSDMSQMTSMLENKTGDEFDKAFLGYMIEHHNSAVDMAKLADKNAKHDEVKQLSVDIVTAQNQEIDQMKMWQTEWGYGASNEDHTQMGH
ncbi:MAG: DUF305 domain-containing protein [Patescibacteria group bacterium]